MLNKQLICELLNGSTKCPFCEFSAPPTLADNRLIYIHLLHIHPLRLGCLFGSDALPVELLDAEQSNADRFVQKMRAWRETTDAATAVAVAANVLMQSTGANVASSTTTTNTSIGINPIVQQQSQSTTGGSRVCMVHRKPIWIACRNMSASGGICRHGRFCTYIHPTCPLDERCVDVNCIFDHTNRFKYCFECIKQRLNSV